MSVCNDISPEQVVHGLAAKMRDANLEWLGSNKPWTAKLKHSLREIFDSDGETGTEVLCTDAEHGKQEFMLDLVVWNRSAGEGILLAVECEWNQHTTDIEQDFWKLMVVKSPLKLMIFALNLNARTHTQEAVWHRLSGCLLKYRDHQKGERYVFMDYAPAPMRRAWWIEIPADGRLNIIPEKQYLPFE